MGTCWKYCMAKFVYCWFYANFYSNIIKNTSRLLIVKILYSVPARCASKHFENLNLFHIHYFLIVYYIANHRWEKTALNLISEASVIEMIKRRPRKNGQLYYFWFLAVCSFSWRIFLDLVVYDQTKLLQYSIYYILTNIII